MNEIGKNIVSLAGVKETQLIRLNLIAQLFVGPFLLGLSYHTGADRIV